MTKQSEINFGRALARTTKPVRYIRGVGRRLAIVGEKEGLSSIRPAIYYAGKTDAIAIAVEVGAAWYFYDAVSGDYAGSAGSERVTIEANVLIIAPEKNRDGAEGDRDNGDGR